MLKAGTRRDSALDRDAGLASRTARTLGGSRRWRLQIGHGIDPGGDYRKPNSGALGFPTARFFSTRRRLAIYYCAPILIDVRQWTFVRQHLAEIAVLNPRAA